MEVGDRFQLLVDIPQGISNYGAFDFSCAKDDIVQIINNDLNSLYVDVRYNDKFDRFIARKLFNDKVFKKIS